MLELKEIVKCYGQGDNSVLALNGVSLSFRKSEFVSILGASGCGKTTLLNIIGGLDKYTSGDICIDGVSTKLYKDADWDVYRNHSIGFVFQSYNLIPHLTVLENVEMALNIGGENSSARRQKAIEVLNKVGLVGQEKKLPSQLSGGQMQRVAIARALITNPEIILADEPTGALDSVTSVQIMDLLKEVAQEKLVIMVTHNPELAEKYSTRIITLRDGSVEGDTNPYEIERTSENKVITGKTSMSFWTAVKSSFKNLISKKARTILTCIAGSIGIIGIALILSVSNGMSAYMKSMQVDSLSEFPIGVSAISGDMTKIMSMGTLDGMSKNMELIIGGDGMTKFPDGSVVYPYESSFQNALSSLITKSKINDEFMAYVKNMDPSLINAVQYFRTIESHIVLKYDEDAYVLLNSTDSGWQELLDNAEYMKTQYDVINVSGVYPEKADEIAIVVDAYNRISTKILDALHIDYVKSEDDLGYLSVPFEDLLGVELSLINNDVYFAKNENGVFVQSATPYEEMYAVGKKLKVTAVLRTSENAKAVWLSSGLAYTPALTSEILATEKDSEIVKAQAKAYQDYLTEKQTNDKAVVIDVKTGKAMQNEWVNMLTLVSKFSGIDVNQVFSIDDETIYLEAMRKIAGTDLPSVIFIYPSNFENKEKVVEYLNAYNQGKEEDDRITITDTTSAMIGMVQSMISAVSYVLIAFAAISLIVSSVMIGIITYVSVMERTKEIGVLRAMGARKLDITRIFNAETLMIGSTSGVLAIIVSYLLNLVISAILKALSGISGLAVLSPLNALILIALCIVLTVVSGLIPAIMASKKDPVVALRAE